MLADFSVGRQPHVDDIIESTIVAGNFSGELLVLADGFYLIGANTTTTNLTLISGWETLVDDLNAQYLMEPGRYGYVAWQRNSIGRRTRG